jgi:hypothetical protein
MGAASAVMGMKDTGMLGSWKNPAAGNLYMPGGAVTQIASQIMGPAGWDGAASKELEEKYGYRRF